MREAIQALENGDYAIIDETRTFRSFESLGVNTMEEVLQLALDFLDEIHCLGAEKCFCGIAGRVEFCQKRGFEDVRLHAYSWNSPSMKKEMYLKFGVRKKGKTPIFSYQQLSCHQSEPPRR